MKTRPTTQYVPHTLDGKTRMIPVEVDTPAPPRDWDHLVLNGVTGIAALVLTASVVWSTASIGDLLARVVIEPAAYGGAVVFDLVWIACMAVEWLSRYDADRARLPRRAGHAALAVAMAAVAAHGYIAGQLVIGVVGAVVSGLAKGLWSVVLAHQTPALDPRTREFLRQELAEAGATMAVIPARRRVQRMQFLATAERIAIDPARRARAEDASADGSAELVHPSTELHGAAGTPVEDHRSLWGMHGPIVYFLGNGSRVKIGTTKNLPSRLSTLCLPRNALLCAFHGGHDIERRFHAMFTEHRVPGTEWFEREGSLAEFIAAQTGDASPDAGRASGDTPDDAGDADRDAQDETPAPLPLPPMPAGASKTALILAASSALQPGAAPAAIAHLLAQHGHAVDTAYVRTVLSRNAGKDDEIGKGGGGYA